MKSKAIIINTARGPLVNELDLINAINICKKYNCITLGVVNVVDSMIAQMVDCGVYLNCSREKAVASTKSFTSSLIVLSLVAMWFKEKHFL